MMNLEPPSSPEPAGDTVPLGMVFLIAVAYWILLLFISGSISTMLWMHHTSVDTAMGMWGARIPWPLLVLLFPVVVFILLALFARRDAGDLIPNHRPPSSVIQNETGMSAWFQSAYTKSRLFSLLKLITMVWAILFFTQLMFWFGFRSYRM